MVRRRSTVRFRKGARRGVHTSPWFMVTFGSDSLAAAVVFGVFGPCRGAVRRRGVADGGLRGRRRLLLALAARVRTAVAVGLPGPAKAGWARRRLVRGGCCVFGAAGRR